MVPRRLHDNGVSTTFSIILCPGCFCHDPATLILCRFNKSVGRAWSCPNLGDPTRWNQAVEILPRLDRIVYALGQLLIVVEAASICERGVTLLVPNNRTSEIWLLKLPGYGMLLPLGLLNTAYFQMIDGNAHLHKHAWTRTLIMLAHISGLIAIFSKGFNCCFNIV